MENNRFDGLDELEDEFDELENLIPEESMMKKSMVNWTFDKNEAVINIIDKFINKYRITCAEQIYQSDEVNLALPELMEEIIDELF